MIAVQDFVEFDVANCEAEKKRLERAISSLTECPPADRARLVEGFLKIIADPDENLGHRVQAASMLAFQSKRLGICGAQVVARTVCEVVQQEVARLTLNYSPQTGDETCARIEKLEGPERLLIGNLIAAALFIDYATGEPLLKKLNELLADEDALSRIREVAETAKRGRNG